MKKKQKKNEVDLFDLGEKIGKLTSRIANLELHFTNHLHRHWIDRLLNVFYFALVIIMFCFLKWGK